MDKVSKQKQAFLSKDRILRGITEDGFLKVVVLKSTDVVKEASRRHGLSLLGTVMLGRALTSVMLLAADLKGEERVILRIEGDGLLGTIVAEANYAGEIRGYVQNPQANLNIAAGQTLEDGVGKGILSVSKILFSHAQPVTGMIAMTQSTIYGDISDYLFHSEQVPSTLLLDVGISAEGEVEEAGGILVQALPGAPVEHIMSVQENLQKIRSISAMLQEGDYIDSLMAKALDPLPFKHLAKHPVHFFCRCSKKRFGHSISMLPIQDLEEMKKEEQETVCHYCNEVYHFAPEEIQIMLAQRLANDPLMN